MHWYAHGNVDAIRRSFQEKMVSVLGYSEAEAAVIEKKALPKYKKIIAGLPEFEKADRFKMNIVNCAMLSVFYLHMEEKPDAEQMTEYYEKAMMIGPMHAFCRMVGKNFLLFSCMAERFPGAVLMALIAM